MAEESHLLKHLIRMAQSYNDEAWEALANKGLLKRAKKDLGKGILPRVQTIGENEITMTWENNTIRLPGQGFAKAICSCAAHSICHHILLAGLALAQYEKNREPSPDVKANNELLELTPRSLLSWAQKANIRKAFAILRAETALTMTEDCTIRFTLPGIKQEIIYIPGAGLEGMIVTDTGSKFDKKALVAACVMAFWQKKGIEHSLLKDYDIPPGGDASGLRIDPGLPDAVKDLLAESVQIGLAHLSGLTLDRMYALSCSARASHLPRLAYALKALVDQAKALERREAAADSTELFRQLARTFGLCLALKQRNPATHLIGVSRSAYEGMKTLELTGLGAYPWQTASGFTGLTVLFLDTRNREILTFSDSRPLHQQAGFDPYRIYTNGSLWQSGISIQRLCRSNFILHHPRINEKGRISSSVDSFCTDITEVPMHNAAIQELAIDNWEDLIRKGMRNKPVGLQEYEPRADLVVLKPKGFSKREFDPLTQTLFLGLIDRQDNLIPLCVPYLTWNAAILDHLKALKLQSMRDTYLVGKISRRQAGMCILPYAFIEQKKEKRELLNLGLDYKGADRETNQPSKLSLILEKILPPSVSQVDPEEIPDSPGNFRNIRTYQLLLTLEKKLCSLAEAGIHAFSQDLKDCTGIAPEEFEKAGLTVLSQYYKGLLQTASLTPGSFLFLMYLLILHQELSNPW